MNKKIFTFLLTFFVFLSGCSTTQTDSSESPPTQTDNPEVEVTAPRTGKDLEMAIATGDATEEEMELFEQSRLASKENSNSVTEENANALSKEQEDQKEYYTELFKKIKVLNAADISNGSNIRFQITTIIPADVSEQDILIISTALAQQLINDNKEVNAVAFLFYDNEVYNGRTFPLAKAEWAPNGEWAGSGNTKTGDYSTHKLTVAEFRPLNEDHELDETELAIFDELSLMIESNENLSDEDVYNALAKQYSIAPEDVSDISLKAWLRRNDNLTSNLSIDFPTK